MIQSCLGGIQAESINIRYLNSREFRSILNPHDFSNVLTSGSDSSNRVPVLGVKALHAAEIVAS